MAKRRGRQPLATRLGSRAAVRVAPRSRKRLPAVVWVQTATEECGGDLLRLDPADGRIVVRTPLPYPSEGERLGALAAGGGAVWVKHGCTRGKRVDRVSSAGGVTMRLAVPGVDGLTIANGNLWAIAHDGTLTQIAAASGRVQQRWSRLAPLSDPNTRTTKTVVADGAGVWVLGTGTATIFHIDHGRVLQRIRVDASVRPLLAKAPDVLWIATEDRLGTRNRLVRLDPDTGAPTATLELGARQPVALLPSHGLLSVLTANGQILLVRS